MEDKAINLQSLMDTPTPKRDALWEQNLLEIFADSSMFMKHDEPFQGPDGYSYVAVSSVNDENKESVDIKDLLNWCYETGVGLVLNLKEKKSPDYVFTNGMIWNYLLRGSFVNEIKKDQEKQNNQVQDKILVHEIAEGFLPKVVRNNIKEFLNTNGFKDIKISLLSGGQDTDYQIIWYSKDFSTFDEKTGITLLESLAWFLPGDYNMGLSKEDNPDLRFQDL